MFPLLAPQHAFHHIEQHLDKTANQYIQWRYAIGEDREALNKVDRQITEEEKKKMMQQVGSCGLESWFGMEYAALELMLQ